MQYDNTQKAEVLNFIHKDPSYLCTLLLLRLHEEFSVNFLKKCVVLTVFLRIAEVSL